MSRLHSSFRNPTTDEGVTSTRERSYSLRILQQPIRARMCGFGDRDRRLLTPPVIVELLIYDQETGQQLDAEEVDANLFVLNADLWDSNCTQEVNIVMHPVFLNPDSASNVASTSTSHPQAFNRHDVGFPSSRIPSQSMSSTSHYGLSRISSTPSTPENISSSFATQPQSTTEMAYTRNLIGALAQSPSKLKGLDGRTGIFFIFHDLSIRTEGIFRFRFVFLSLEHHGRRAEDTVDVRASIFTEPFQVFSAKKFPGMLGPTPLTKHFAAQRVRIPTRVRKTKDESAVASDEEGEANLMDS